MRLPRTYRGDITKRTGSDERFVVASCTTNTQIYFIAVLDSQQGVIGQTRKVSLYAGSRYIVDDQAILDQYQVAFRFTPDRTNRVSLSQDAGQRTSIRFIEQAFDLLNGQDVEERLSEFFNNRRGNNTRGDRLPGSVFNDLYRCGGAEIACTKSGKVQLFVDVYVLGSLDHKIEFVLHVLDPPLT